MPAKAPSLPNRTIHDAIVLGSQPAGLMAGALLAKRGLRVLHLNIDGSRETYDDREYRLPSAPALFPPFRSMPEIEAAFSELALTVDLHRATDAGAHTLQLLLPNHRFEFSPDARRRQHEFGREFPSSADALESWLSEMDRLVGVVDPYLAAAPLTTPSTLWERLRRLLRDSRIPHRNEALSPLVSPCPEPLDRALDGLQLHLGYRENTGTPTPLSRRPLSLATRGLYRFPFGLAGLAARLQARIEASGGSILGPIAQRAHGTPPPTFPQIDELLFTRGHFSGLRLAGHPDPIRAPLLIAALDLEALAPLLPADFPKRRLGKLTQQITRAHSLLPVNFVLSEEGLPVGLQSNAIVYPEAGTPHEPLGPILLQLDRVEKNGLPVEGECVLSTAALFPGEPATATNEELVAFARQLEAALEPILPFVERHIKLRSIPALVARTLHGPSPSPHPRFTLEVPSASGVGGLPPKGLARGLLLANRQLLPGLGLEGELLAGVRVARMAQATRKKHNPLA